VFVALYRTMAARRTVVLKLPLLALAAFNALPLAADSWPYMKRANSNELPLLIETRDCPIDAATVRQMAESVLTRRQIAPLDPTKVEVPLAPPWLSVNVACLGGGLAFRTDVDFIGRQGADLVRLSLNSYGGLGMAEDKDGAYILDELQQRVEAAVADYVEANSEPEPGVPPATSRRSNRAR
jgi:hypothetical protein